jgi:hypothetical protein
MVSPGKVLVGGTVELRLCAPQSVAEAFAHAEQKVATFTVKGRTYKAPLVTDDPWDYHAEAVKVILQSITGRYLDAASACRIIAVPVQIGAQARTAQGKVIFIVLGGYVQVVRIGAGCPNAGAAAANRPRCSRVPTVTFAALPNTVSSPGATDLLLPCSTPVGNSFGGQAWRPNGVVMYDVVSFHNLVYKNGRLVAGAFPVRSPIRLGWTPAGPDDIFVTIPQGISPTKYVIVVNTATADVPEDSETTVK